MDRPALLAHLPDGPAFHAMAKRNQKEVGENLIASILDAIESEGREPDEWEALDLNAALVAILGRMYTAAIVYAERSLVPVVEREERDWSRRETTPTIKGLRLALEYIRGIPAPNT